ncbi:MAG: carboxypeptidase regulatory-like domain-containing protein [Vicinamibacterales bacterium]
MRVRLMTATLLALALGATVPTFGQERFGSLTGTVTDQQGAAIPGVSVVITSMTSGESRVFVTDSSGKYTAPDLNPGRYRVAFELSGFNRVEREDVSVALGRTFALDARLQVGAVTETVQVTAEAVPLVDNRSTLVAHNVSEEEFNRMPKTRSFQSIAFTAPSVNQGEIEGGMQVNGASGAENAFTVDGIVTNSLINGQSRQNTVFEYLQEVQVKTSGIAAEFGGALGGVVSAVTRSGGNVFRGEGHYYYEGSALQAAPVKRLVLEPFQEQSAFFVQDAEQPRRFNEFGGSVGGPIVRDRLFFFGSYSPRNEFSSNTYRFTDESGDVARDIWRQQAFGKLTLNTRRANVNWSTLWTPTSTTGTLNQYDGPQPNELLTTKASIDPNIDRGYEINQVNTSATVDVTLTNSSFFSVRGGLFHDRYRDTGIPNVTPWTYGVATTAVDSLIPASLQGPSGVLNTPRAEIADFDTTRRYTVNADYNRVFSAAGFHTLKAGYGFQHVLNDINTYYPGGYVNIFWGRSFTFGGQTGTGTYGYYEVNDRRIANRAGANIHSLYVQDQWTLGNKLTLNLGVRTEDERIPTFRPEYQETAFHFTFADKLAPRLGAAYDIRGDGRVKVFGSWGLYYDWTKYELPRGSFGAETWCIYYRGLNTLNIDSLSLDNMPGNDLWVNPGSCRDRRVPSFAGSIDPDIRPMKQSSASGGLEYQIGRNSVATVRYVHNDLLEAIEDIGFLNAEGDEGYLIGNPGRGQTAIQFPYGATPLGQPTPRPKRQYDALEVGYNRRFADNWFFSANYTLSRLYGNYPGLASSDEITTPTTGGSSAAAQQQAGSIFRPGGNVNRAWDIDELLWDSRGNLDVVGRLATDRPHVVKLYGSYDFPFGTQIGAFFYGGSGTPISTYVTTTNSADMFVYGRGDMGRTPVLTRTDLLVTHELRLPDTKRLRFELNVQNLFNQKTVRHVYNYLNKGGLIPDRSSSFIDLSDVDLRNGFDVDQKILATPDGPSAYDPRYGMADLFEDGLRGFVTVKFLF